MKNILPILLVLIAAVSIANGQNHRWELGPIIGLTSYQGDLVQKGYDLNETHVGYGLFIRNNIHPNVSFRANFIRGNISGDDSNYDEFADRGFTFSSPVSELSLQLEVDILGQKRYPDVQSFRNTVSPYFFGGLGFAMFKQSVDYNELFNQTILEEISIDKESGLNNQRLVVPFGIGVKFDLTPKLTFGLEWGARAVFSDLLDGVSQAGDPNDQDWYNIGSATFAMRFGEKDRDRDGVPDSRDRCPQDAGSKGLNGCPDIDEDGIRDKDDDCPYEKGYGQLNGCPDLDKDGIADKDDKCPNDAGIAAYGGCPIQDADGDGVPDEEDKCPYEVGLAKRKGCPYSDRDDDGIEDNEDRCPDAPGFGFNKGCPDTDNDGIVDIDDNCPRIQGLERNAGCPDLIGNNDDDILNFSEVTILFENDQSVILPEYNKILDQVAKVLDRYPEFNVRLEGYSDDHGNDFVSQQISQERAQKCYEYLIQKGIDKSRLIYRGYGENNPVAPNTTAEGRAKNRRVEFILFKAK